MKTHGGVFERDIWILPPGTFIAGHQVQRDGSWIRLTPGKTYRNQITGSLYLALYDGTLKLLPNN